MAGLSDIEWTDATWNPVAGCRIVSAGCKNCYAMRMAARLQAMEHYSYQGITKKIGDRHVWTGKINMIESAIDVPLSWKKPKFVFVNSMSDLFQDSIPFDFLERVWSVMERAPIHTFQILTKQPDRMAQFLRWLGRAPLRNVWLGTSVEDRRVTPRIDVLRQCEAAIRFISFEPLIGAVGALDLSGIHWAIVGGESGPRARDLRSAWVAQIHSQCREQGLHFFFKQWGGVHKKRSGRTFRGRTWDEMPEMHIARPE